jgi:hypothetical protein
MTKYSGLLYAMERQEKRAFLEGYEAWQNRHPALSLGASLLPFGVGSAVSLTDAARSFSKGNILGGIGNTLLAGASFLPGGGIVGKGIAKGGKALLKLLRFGGKAGGRLHRVAAVGEAAGRRVLNANNRMVSLAAPMTGWKPTTAALGLTIGGGMLEGMRTPIPPGEGNPGVTPGAMYGTRPPPQSGGWHSGSPYFAMNANRADYSGHPGGRLGSMVDSHITSHRPPMQQPFDEAGFFTPRSGPQMYRGLAAFNPGANRNTLPFGG